MWLFSLFCVCVCVHMCGWVSVQILTWSYLFLWWCVWMDVWVCVCVRLICLQGLPCFTARRQPPSYFWSWYKTLCGVLPQQIWRWHTEQCVTVYMHSIYAHLGISIFAGLSAIRTACPPRPLWCACGWAQTARSAWLRQTDRKLWIHLFLPQRLHTHTFSSCS